MTDSLIRVVAFTAAVLGGGAQALAQSLPTPAPMLGGEPAYELADPDGVLHNGGVGKIEMIDPPRGDGAFRPLAPIPLDYDNSLPLPDLGPAVTESTGTWLRRGLWYADVDAVIMQRTWNSSDAVFFQEYDLIQNQIILNVGVTNAAQVTTIQSAEAGETSPNAEGMARLALGRFLFRDQKNRDHTAEMIIFGGGEFNEQQHLEAIYTNIADGNGFIQQLPDGSFRVELGLHITSDGSTPLNIDTPDARPSFDQAFEGASDYSSRFHTWEWNYNVTERMSKDRMELQPNGEWVRRASPGLTWSYLAGMRYLDLEEQLDLVANDIRSLDVTGGVNGSYFVKSSNNLFGGQLGLGMTYESDRWNVTLHTKHGFYVNDARVTEDLRYENLPADSIAGDFSLDNHGNALSFVSQGGITGRYHLRPNFSLRAGWEYLFVSGVALAPNDATFLATKEQIGITADIFYQGVSFGTEYYW